MKIPNNLSKVAEQGLNAVKNTVTHSPPVHFGKGQDVVKLVSAIPAHVKVPKYTDQGLLMRTMLLITQKGAWNRIKNLASLLYAKLQIKWAYHQGNAYLPADVRSRVRKYQWSFQFVRDWLKDAGAAKRQLVILKGPIEIKHMQARVETARAQLKQLQAAKPLLEMIPGKRIIGFLIDRQIKGLEKEVKIFSPLLDSLPSLPAASYQKELEALKKAFEAQHPGNTFTGEIKPLASASIAQTFLVNTQKPVAGGEPKVVLKLLREGANPKALQEMRDYLYYQHLMTLGGQNKQQAASATDVMIANLLKEIQLDQEAVHAEQFKKALHQLNPNTKIQIPEFLASTPSGFVQSYAGPQTLNQLTTSQEALKEKVLEEIVPDLIAMKLFSPLQHGDLHGGNLIPHNGQISLIDYGKLSTVDSGTHQRFLDLLQKTYSYPHPEQALKDPAVRQALSSFVEGPISEEAQERLLTYLSERPLDMIRHYTNWENSLEGIVTPEAKLKPLEHLAELRSKGAGDAYKKFRNLCQPYFHKTPSAAEMEQARVLLKDPASFVDIFGKMMWKYGSDLTKSFPAYHEMATAALHNDVSAYQGYLSSLLKDTKRQDIMLRLVSVNKRFNDLADQLVARWPDSASLSADARKRLRQNLAQHLKEEFHLESPADILKGKSR